MTKWDPSLHPHGVHGHWATVGGKKTGRKKVNRSGSEEGARGVMGHGPSAFKERTSATERRERLQRIRKSQEIFHKDPNTLTTREQSNAGLEHEPWKMNRRTPPALTGRRKIPLMEAKKSEARVTGGRASTPLRITQGHRTEIVHDPRTGKARVRRGDRPEVPHPTKGFVPDLLIHRRIKEKPTARTTARKLMSAPKPTKAAPAHKQYTHKDLSLFTNAWMRDRLKERGVAIPKGANTKILTSLLASD